MKYQTASGFRTALEERLRTVAREHGQDALTRQRKLVVFDRLIARLLAVAPDRWIIKGGLALDLRLGDRARTTRDVDIARQDDEEAATADLLAAQGIDLGDHFTFSIERTARLDTATDGAAVRYRAVADVAGRRFDSVIIDIGFDDPLLESPDILLGPTFLTFAGIEPVAVPALPLQQHIAEKVHAYTRTYDRGRASTRVKDLVDLALIRSAGSFDAGSLRSALDQTFITRATHPLPPTLPPPPSGWTTPYRRLATGVGIEPTLRIGYQRSAEWLDPILNRSARDEARWNDVRGEWEGPGEEDRQA